MSSSDPKTTNTKYDVDPEMLEHLGLLSNYDELDSEDLWDDFVKNFSDVEQAIQSETEKELENEN